MALVKTGIAVDGDLLAKMSVMIYSRLGDVLRVQGLSVGELRDRIATRFGLAIDVRALDRLTRDERVHGPDFELGGAAAVVLDVGLDDVFVVQADVKDAHGTNMSDTDDGLDPEQDHRMEDLFTLQEERPLTDEERDELHALVAAYGQAAYEQGVERIARARGVPVDMVRAEFADERTRAAAWYHDLEAEPARREALVQDALERQRTRAVG